MKEKLPGLFRPLMKFNVTAVMVIILMFSVFNVFSIVRTQQRQASPFSGTAARSRPGQTSRCPGFAWSALCDNRKSD